MSQLVRVKWHSSSIRLDILIVHRENGQKYKYDMQIYRVVIKCMMSRYWYENIIGGEISGAICCITFLTHFNGQYIFYHPLPSHRVARCFHDAVKNLRTPSLSILFLHFMVTTQIPRFSQSSLFRSHDRSSIFHINKLSFKKGVTI